MELEPGLACHPELLEEQGVAVWKVGCELVRHGRALVIQCSCQTMVSSLPTLTFCPRPSPCAVNSF